MASYNIVISSTAEKALKRIPKKEVHKILNIIQSLAHNPYPNGCRKLAGENTVFRIRQGNYRVIYEVHDNQLKVLVLKIGHRKDIYR